MKRRAVHNTVLSISVMTVMASSTAFARPVLHFSDAVTVADRFQKYSPEMMRRREEAEKVIASNKEKTRRNPDDVQAHKALGDAYLFLEEYESAFNSYKEVLRLKPNDAQAYRGMGEAYEKVGEDAKALDFYKEAVRHDPKFARAQTDLGKALVALFRYKEAISPLTEGIRLKATGEIDHDDYFNLGEAYLNTNQYQDAVVAYQKALQMLPGHVWSQVGMAEAYNALKQYENAIASVKRARDEHPYDRKTNRVLGDSYAGMGQYEKAIEYYKESIRVSAHRYQIEALLGLGRTYLTMGRHEEALETFQKGIQYASTPRQFAGDDEINPWFLSALYFGVAQADVNLGRGKTAAEAARKYIELQTWSDQNSTYAALMSYFGNRKSGQNEEARKMLDEASAHMEAKTWPAPVFKYLKGDLNEDGLLKLAIDNDKMTEARAYVGMNLALAGRGDAARPHLEWVVKNGNREFIEYIFAQSELNRLTKAR